MYPCNQRRDEYGNEIETKNTLILIYTSYMQMGNIGPLPESRFGECVCGGVGNGSREKPHSRLEILKKTPKHKLHSFA